MQEKFKTTAKINEDGVVEYGIATANEVIVINGISTNKEAVESLTASFNRYDLSETHLREAVDDFVNSL